MKDILAHEIQAICQFDLNAPFCQDQSQLRDDL
jgi:hypothetical protein